MAIRIAVIAAFAVFAGWAAIAEEADVTHAKELARQGLNMWSAEIPIDRSIFTDGYRNHQEPIADSGDGTIDLDGWVATVAANHVAFPDLKVEFLSQTAESDLVATHWRFSATQTGPYLGHDATGRPVSWTGVQIDRIEGGRIAESWVVWDFYTQLQQLGLPAR